MTFDKIKEIAENLGWIITEDGENDYLFSQASPAGEDFAFTTQGATADEIIDDIAEYSTYFSKDEHVAMWMEASRHGLKGVPSLLELVRDAEAIEQMLQSLVNALKYGEIPSAEPVSDSTSFAETKWNEDDAIEAAAANDVTLSAEEAAEWWRENEKWFEDSITQYGNELLSDIDWRYVQDKKYRGVKEAAWLVGSKGFIMVQSCDNGYDYTIVTPNYEHIDGGQIEQSEMSIVEARDTILESIDWVGHALVSVNCDELMSNVHE